MINTLKCWIYGHPELTQKENKTSRYEACPRCGTIKNHELTYYGQAMKYLERTRQDPTFYEPVEELTDASGRTLEVGDRIKYKEFNQTFPGLHLGTSGRVEFLFKGPDEDGRVKVPGHRMLIHERRIMGFRKGITNDSAECSRGGRR